MPYALNVNVAKFGGIISERTVQNQVVGTEEKDEGMCR